MKKTILSILTMLALTGLVQAQQQLINSGFESWDTLGDYTQPSSWFSLNPLVQIGFDPSTTLTTDAHSGNFAVVLESKSNQFADYAGVLCTGPLLNANLEPDFDHMKIAFNLRPERIRFYYKSFPKSGDTCAFAMVLTRWNVSLEKIDTIGHASLLMKDSIGVYTLADVAFNYSSPLPPDSAFVIVSSSLDGFHPITGSKLQIDDIEIIYTTTGLGELHAIAANIYPNPVKDLLTIDLRSNKTAGLELYDRTGRLVYQSAVDQTKRTIDVSALDNGIYMIVLQNRNGERECSKLIIQH